MHDVPLLVENGMGAAFALVLVVDAPVDVRVTRLVEARGMTVEDARARMAAQADDDARRAAADVWLENAGGRGRAARAGRASVARAARPVRRERRAPPRRRRCRPTS